MQEGVVERATRGPLLSTESRAIPLTIPPRLAHRTLRFEYEESYHAATVYSFVDLVARRWFC
jgi:hypothetical protein